MPTTVSSTRSVVLGALALGMVLLPLPAFAIDFGDDKSEWANDGECDDPRFGGPGMTETPRLEEDILHDGTDCKQAFDAGRIVFGKWEDTEGNIDFGDDTSEWANDGECDDPRFAGPGMTTTPLLDADIRRDATDCKQAYNAERITLASSADSSSPTSGSMVSGGVNFGDDASQWANDGECDDPRFEGAGMTSTPLLDTDILHDATDCMTAFDAGNLNLKPGADNGMDSVASGGDVDFGDDSSQWANDGECDDPRFSGEGMTATVLLDSDTLHDATDCRTAFEAGTIVLGKVDTSGVDFGDDSSEWANDNECDDPRFEGPGMTDTPLLDTDVLHDASDCKAAYSAGTITLR